MQHFSSLSVECETQHDSCCEWHPAAEQKMEDLAKILFMRLQFLVLFDKRSYRKQCSVEEGEEINKSVFEYAITPCPAFNPKKSRLEIRPSTHLSILRASITREQYNFLLFLERTPHSWKAVH